MRSHPIEYYRSRLRADRHQLDDELEDHALLMEQISQACAAANTAALRAKEQLAKVEARLVEDLKAEDSSLTVQRLDGKVKRHPDRREAFDAWMQARQEHEEWLGMQDAWKTRGFTIRNLSELFANQYFALDSTRAPRRRIDERTYEQARERMSGERVTRRRVME